MTMERRWLAISGAMLLLGFVLGWVVRSARIGETTLPIWELAKLQSADPIQRTEAAWALAFRPVPEAAEALAKTLLDKEDHVRLASAVALARIGEPAIVPTLKVVKEEEAARDPQQPFHFLPGQFFRRPQDAAEFILAHIARSSDGAKVVAKLLESKDPLEARIAQAALQRVGAPALLAVMPYLSSERREVRFAALSVIGSCGEASIDVLRKFLMEEKDREGDQEIRQIAVYTLGNTKSDKALPILKELLKDPQLETTAWQVIGQMRTDGAKKFLLERAKIFAKEKRDPHPAMVWAIGASQIPEAKPYLLQWLKSSNPRVQEAGALAIGMMQAIEPQFGREALPQLISLLNSKDAGVVYHTAIALGRIADRKALPALIKALQRKEFPVLQSVLDAIQSISEKAALPAVEALLKKSDLPSDVRKQAQRVAEYLRQYGR